MQLVDESTPHPLSVASVYRVVLTMPGDVCAERRLRHLIVQKRGELWSLQRSAPRRAGRVQLYLGMRRIDDVVAALEGAGFTVDAVVATREPSRLRPEARSSARSSNL
jgi:hypothetical protein